MEVFIEDLESPTYIWYISKSLFNLDYQFLGWGLNLWPLGREYYALNSWTMFKLTRI